MQKIPHSGEEREFFLPDRRYRLMSLLRLFANRRNFTQLDNLPGLQSGRRKDRVCVQAMLL